MDRSEILDRLIGEEKIPLWVALLTHYQDQAGKIVLDESRMVRHAREVSESVYLQMLGGTTGDGWDLTPGQFEAMVALADKPEFAENGAMTLIGVLRKTTAETLDWIGRFHKVAGTSASASLEENIERLAEKNWIGLMVPPPSGIGGNHDKILDHYAAVAQAARLPLGVYQIPQVTGSTVEPLTMAELAAKHPEIILFKDSSGKDTIAKTALDIEGVMLTRGFEGHYVESLKAMEGPYDGLFLGSANVFGPEIKAMLDALRHGKTDKAQKDSDWLSALVERLMKTAADAAPGKAFSLVNRAADHILAYGTGWTDQASPQLVDGSLLAQDILKGVAAILDEEGLISETGYLS